MSGTREHILKNSLRLFLKQSYRDVTMKEIVEESGVSKGAFYHHFPSKESLFKEIVSLFFSLGSLDYDSFPQEGLRAFYRRYLWELGASMHRLSEWLGESESSQPGFNFFFLMFEAVGRFPEFLEQETEMYERDKKAWAKVIANARKSGEIHSQSPDHRIAELFLASVDGVFLRFLNKRTDSSYVEDLEVTFDTIYENLQS